MKRLALLVGLAAGVVGCQQKMAEQPAPRTYEQHPFFANNQSARPLEEGVIYRGQPGKHDPLVTGISDKGRVIRAAYRPEDLDKATPEQKKQLEGLKNIVGAPNDLENFIKEFPFEINAEDMSRGQLMYNTNCALCHGAAGDGKGKIAERGTLWPPSYHTDPEGKKTDTYGSKQFDGLGLGYSRGFARYSIREPLKTVPVGYIFEVISRGYGAMPSHASQITPADRWRIVAYVRALQLSQGADFDKLPADVKEDVKKEMTKSADKAKGDQGHAAGEKH